jgi:hypothetical protein
MSACAGSDTTGAINVGVPNTEAAVLLLRSGDDDDGNDCCAKVTG